MYKKSLLMVLIVSILLYGCGQLTASQVSSKATATKPPGITDLEASIQRVENGLVKMTMAGPSPWKKKLPLAERMEHYQVPGVSIAVINDFGIEWTKGYGVLEAGGDEPVTTETLFNAGSIAKPVSAAAALTLVERGLLNLDENVNEKLVSWQVPENEFTVEEKVTLRRLLSHSAGIEDGFTNRSSYEIDAVPEYVVPAGQAPTVTLQELLDAAPGVDVDGPTFVATVPGTGYNYANADYAILELLMDDVNQQPFDEFMRVTLLEPLGMTSSTYEQPLPEDLRLRAATEHYANGLPFEGERHHFPIRAAGGLWTTPSDLARFAIEIMLAYNGRSDQLLSQGMANEMLSPQIEIEGDPLRDSSGLGFFLQREDDGLLLLHTGGTWGSTCVLIAYPETGQGAVVMTNSANGTLFLFEVLYSIAAEYGWP